MYVCFSQRSQKQVLKNEEYTVADGTSPGSVFPCFVLTLGLKSSVIWLTGQLPFVLQCSAVQSTCVK